MSLKLSCNFIKLLTFINILFILIIYIESKEQNSNNKTLSEKTKIIKGLII